MNKLFFLLILFQLLFFASCSQKTNCEQLPTQFSSYNDASKKIKEVNFKISDKLNTSKSSWITSASYYSCDGETGYFIFVAKGNEYIHIGVPYAVWGQFKNAESFGSFYNKNLKHKFTLLLNQ